MKMKRMKNRVENELLLFIRVFNTFGISSLCNDARLQMALYLYQGLIILATILAGIFALFIRNAYQTGTLSSLVSGLVFTAQVVAHITSIVQTFFTRKKELEMFEIIREIDDLFRTKLSMHVNVKQIKRRILSRTAAITSLLVVFTIVNSCSLIETRFSGPYWYAFFSVQTLKMRCIQNMIYVSLIEERLRLLNFKVEEIVVKNDTYLPLTLFAREYNKINPVNRRFTGIEKILTFKQIYSRLWDTMNLVNDCFGWSLLAIVTCYFLDFTSSAYWLFLGLESYLPKPIILQCSSNMLPLAFLLGILASSSQGCSTSAEITGALVHKIEKSFESDQYNALVSEFSLQIIHEPIIVSANGFFTVNFELLGSMAAATITYLVILIQFLYSENENNPTRDDEA